MTVMYKLKLIIDYTQWSHYFLSINKPNLTQSWSYGEAKMKSQGWKPIRALIYENEEPIALVQLWYKSLLSIKLVRISNGPLWIVNTPSLVQIRGAFDAIKQQWNLKKRSLLVISPNLESHPDHNKVLDELGFYKRRIISYESGWVDLKQSTEDLRIKLRQNWRNQLKSSEKKELNFHVSRKDVDLKWLISCFEILRKEKNFCGHSVSLLTALHEVSFDSNQTDVAIVTEGEERVAGMLIASNGKSCTPLIIWVNKRGRALNAGNFLLWNTVLHAKNKGNHWFDLGGTNASTSFKTGLPHQGYQMIGEYYALL